MRRSLLLIVYGLLHVVHGKDYSEAFKFVGGFLGFDAERAAQAPKQPAGLSVIGAGFPRTGTKSTETALIRLGHKIYDTRSMIELKQADQWVEAAIRIKAGDTGPAEDLLQDIESRGYTATLDLPMNLFSETFAELRPSAKVLFTMRDIDRWFESWHNVNMILNSFIARPWSWIVDMTFVNQICGAFDFDYTYPTFPDHIDRPLPWFEIVRFMPSFSQDDSKDKWISFHNRVKKQLQESLPLSRFIAFDVRQGWAPLLTFLEIDDPQLAAEPFPRVNDIESLKTVRRVMDIVAISLPFWLILSLYLLSYLISKIARCFRRGTSKLKSS